MKGNSQIKFATNSATYYNHLSEPRRKMVFAPNPLALSVPEPAFDSWLRDSGYLEVLDQRTTDLHRLASAAPNTAAAGSTSTTTTTTSISPDEIFFSLLSGTWTLLSLFTFNPFSKLSSNDFSGDTPPWTLAFFGSSESYSFPSSPSQARLRVHENVKRFARNYSSLCMLFFACSLYQLPIALFGLVSCLALWEAFKLGGSRWSLSSYPVLREVLIRVVQCVTAIILMISNVQLAVLYTIGVSYAVMIFHAAFRKLTLAKQNTPRGGYRRTGRRS